MNNKKILLVGTILMIVIFVLLITNFVLPHREWQAKSLVGSGFGLMGNKQTGVSPSPTPSAPPRTFKFDSSIDLKKELDSVNPQVLDSDFE